MAKGDTGDPETAEPDGPHLPSDHKQSGANDSKKHSVTQNNLRNNYINESVYKRLLKGSLNCEKLLKKVNNVMRDPKRKGKKKKMAVKNHRVKVGSLKLKINRENGGTVIYVKKYLQQRNSIKKVGNESFKLSCAVLMQPHGCKKEANLKFPLVNVCVCLARGIRRVR